MLDEIKMQLKFVADAVHNVKWEKVPRSSYGIMESIIPSIILLIPVLILILFKINPYLIMMYYSVTTFLLCSLILHFNSNGASEEKGIINKIKKVKKNIDADKKEMGDDW